MLQIRLASASGNSNQYPVHSHRTVEHTQHLMFVRKIRLRPGARHSLGVLVDYRVNAESIVRSARGAVCGARDRMGTAYCYSLRCICSLREQAGGWRAECV
jgi:hypothetical protein